MPVADQFAAHEAGISNQNAQTEAIQQGPNAGDAGNSGTGGKKPNPQQGDKQSTDGAVEPEPTKKKNNASDAVNADQVSTKAVPHGELTFIGTRVITSEPGSQSGAEVLQPLTQRGTALTHEHRVAIGKAKDAKARAVEAKMHVFCMGRFAIERDTVDSLFAKHRHQRSMRAAPIPDPYFQDVLRQVDALYRAKTGRLTQQWEEGIAPLIASAIDEVGTEFSTAVGKTWSMKNPQVQRAVANRAEQLATYVGPTTAEQITATMHTAFTAGMSMSQTADLVRSAVFGDNNATTRALTIARTESIGALNQGEFTAASLSNVIQQKEWLTQQDDRVRESHQDLDGMSIPLDESFPNGCMHPGDQEGAPEEVINCRCTLLYHGDSVGDIDEEHDDGVDE